MTLDAQILAALRAAGDGAVSGAELSQRAHVSRAAIWARIEELRRLGYEIDASPHAGYTLRGAPDLVHADDLLARLGPVATIGRDIRVFQTTTSTNDVIEKLAQDGVKEGVVVFAEAQSGGRGRMGREWLSPSGKGLWFSLLLRPQFLPQQATRLIIACAVAIRRAIQNVTGLSAEIKWPNDILVRGKKLAGILTEMNGEMDRIRYVIAGIGINVNFGAADFPRELRQTATSLELELGRPVPRADLAVAVLRELEDDYRRVQGDGFSVLAAEWEAHCNTLGKQVAIRTGPRVIRGRAEALGEDGALLLRTEHGHLEPIVGGDVTLEPEP